MAAIVGSYCILGPVPECIRQIEAYVEAGARHVIFAWYGASEDIPRQMQTTAREIIPAVRDRAAVAATCQTEAETA